MKALSSSYAYTAIYGIAALVVVAVGPFFGLPTALLVGLLVAVGFLSVLSSEHWGNTRHSRWIEAEERVQQLYQELSRSEALLKTYAPPDVYEAYREARDARFRGETRHVRRID